jgi:hypothetical protein
MYACGQSGPVDPLLTGSSDKIIRLWDTETGLCKLEMSGHTDSIWAVHYDQGAVITASSDRTVKSIQLNPPTQATFVALGWLMIDTPYACVALSVGHQERSVRGDAERALGHRVLYVGRWRSRRERRLQRLAVRVGTPAETTLAILQGTRRCRTHQHQPPHHPLHAA